MGKKTYLKQAATELDLTEYQLRRMAKEHKIPFLKSGARYIFDLDLAKEYLRNEAMENAKPVETNNNQQYGTLRRING